VKSATNIRNVAIILLIAAAVYALGSTGDFAVSFLVQLVSLAFLAALAWIGSRLYYEHRIDIHSLGSRRRAVLYLALGVLALALTALDRFWSSGLGTVAWLIVVGACVYALYSVYRSLKQY